jgi:hypothetical protein
MVMNANELADEIKMMLADSESYYGNAEAYLIKAEAKLRQLQKERDLLFSAHSHEMVRADELAVENELLKAKLAQADRVYDFDNPLLDVCKHGNDSACKECYLEAVKK